MGKNPAFLFYPGDWRRDTQVQMASMETKGVWIEMLCCMWDAPERGMLSGTIFELSRLLGCSEHVFNRSVDEIKRLKIADVTNCHNEVTIINRRMSREEKDRKNAVLRKRAQRERQKSHTTVTSALSVTVTKKKIKKKRTVSLCFEKFVQMTDDEMLELINRIGEETAWKCIDKLSTYKGSTGKKYKSDYLTMFSWVIEAVQNGKQKPTTKYAT